MTFDILKRFFESNSIRFNNERIFGLGFIEINSMFGVLLFIGWLFIAELVESCSQRVICILKVSISIWPGSLLLRKHYLLIGFLGSG
jgi:hypothetical protein